jgi:hypothetical protein
MTDLAAAALDWSLTPQQRFEKQQIAVDNLYGTTRFGVPMGVKVDQATYDKMTYSGKKAYAEQFQAKPTP